MTRRHRNVAAAFAGSFQVIGLLTGLGASEASAQGTSVRQAAASNKPVPVSVQTSAQHGRIGGKVTDDQGRGIEGALVTALGVTHSLAVSDASGNYTLTLPPGEYHLQVHREGYSTRFRDFVRVAAYGSIVRPITMQRVADRAVMTAGLGGRSILPISSDPKAHPHSEQAWRLRHAKRTALRDTNANGPFDGIDDESTGWLGRAVGAPARLASSLFTELPIDGEVRFLTAGSFGPYASLFSDLATAGVAYMSVRAPIGSHGDWSVRGTMSSADLSTWLLAGDYVAKPRNTHAFSLGMSFGSQGIMPADHAPVPVTAVLPDRTRNGGEVYAFDRWRLSPVLLIDAGARVSYFDYLAADGMLWNPVAAIEITPWGEGSSTMIKAAVSSRSDAPGSAEFTPPPAGPWLPPQRLFSALPGETLSVERTDHAELGIEHQLEDAYTIGVRRFVQRTFNQATSLFGLDRPGLSNDPRHYYVAALGDVTIDGWAMRVSTPAGQPVHGSIDYAIADVEWTPFADASAMLGSVREGVERVHDITTTVGADVPQTKTRMLIVYRVSSAFSTIDEGPVLGSRFDMQLNQGLPLPPSAGKWEVLLSVRNVLRDQRFGMSMLDELLAVSTPTRVVGGVQVKF